MCSTSSTAWNNSRQGWRADAARPRSRRGPSPVGRRQRGLLTDQRRKLDAVDRARLGVDHQRQQQFSTPPAPDYAAAAECRPAFRGQSAGGVLVAMTPASPRPGRPRRVWPGSTPRSWSRSALFAHRSRPGSSCPAELTIAAAPPSRSVAIVTMFTPHAVTSGVASCTIVSITRTRPGALTRLARR